MTKTKNAATSMIKLGSLFDGIGTWQYAATITGITPLWSSEIDDFCRYITAKHFPQTLQLGDIRGISNPPYVDIITAGFPCFPAGTLVLTKNGYCAIEDITVGDYVLTHTGKWQKVLSVGSRMSETVVLKGFGHPHLETTSNHPFYASRKIKKWNNLRRSYDTFMDTPEWLSAEKMAGVFWATPINFDKLTEVPIKNIKGGSLITFNEDFWWFVGRWLGDGWTRNTQRADRKEGQTWGQVFICCSFKETNTLKERLKRIGLHWNVSSMRTTNRFLCSNLALTRWLIKNFGEKAYGKTIPAWVLTIEKKYRQALLDGYFSADGWRLPNGSYSADTVSKKLALGIRLIAESLGYSSALYFFKRKTTSVIEGREIHQRDTYTVRYDEIKKQTKRKEAFGVSWGKVHSITETKQIKQVFNLEVENDNSYCVENIIVHNCQDLSIAGKRAGIHAERSGLFFDAINLIRHVKPKFAVFENVTGLLTSNGGLDFGTVLEQIAETKLPLPERWTNAGLVESQNCQVAWRILDAQYFGVPQRRRRVFIVSSFGTRRAAKILFESKGLQRDFTPCNCEGLPTTPPLHISTGKSYGIGRDAFNQGRNGQFRLSFSEELQPPLTARGAGGVFDGYHVRRLTPIECERLQGLPDNWTLGGSNTARYKALGNGMALPVAVWILNRISRSFYD